MALIAEQSINEIREKANLVEIISSYVTLKKTGRTHKGLCPFHQEKSPSFTVDGQKQLFHCFGCSEGGDVFNFIMKIESLDFAGAAEHLAKITGVSLLYSGGGNNKQSTNQKETYYQINKEAADYYHYMLMQSEQGSPGRQYLKERAYGKNTATTFNLGFAPSNKTSLINHLIKKGYKQQDINTLGLTYINRVMFPIQDARGNFVGFGGRALTNKDMPKYLNTAQTPVFHKSKQFYALNLAKGEIVKQDQAILVEGYTDVISLHSNGFKNTIATLGTALTIEHVQILSRFCSSAIMLFDSDEAGLKAATRTAQFANATSLELLVGVLPSGDPADFVLAKGSEELKKILTKAVPIIDFCLQQLVANADITTPKKRLAVIKTAFELIGNQQNSILEQEYLQKFSKLINVPIQNLVTEYRPKNKAVNNEAAINSNLTMEDKAEYQLLSILLEKPNLVKESLAIISKDDLVSENHKNILEIIASNPQKDASYLINLADDVKLKRYLSALSFANLPENLEQALVEVSKKIKDLALRRQINKIKTVLEKTNPMDNRVEYDKLFKQLIELEANRRNLCQNNQKN